MNQKEAQRAISLLCDELKIMLLCKNREYGNSALEPRRIFSKTTAVEQILIRIDDKLSRILTTRGKDTVIKEDGVELSRKYHRHVVTPDISAENLALEDAEVQAIANSGIWTQAIKDAWAAHLLEKQG